MLTVQLAGWPPFSFDLRHFHHPNSQYSLNLYNLHVIWVSTYLPNLAEAKNRLENYFKGRRQEVGGRYMILLVLFPW